MVTIGVDTECVVVSSSSTQIVCNVGEPPVGDQDLVVNVANLGNSAAFSVQVGNKTKKFSRVWNIASYLQMTFRFLHFLMPVMHPLAILI